MSRLSLIAVFTVCALVHFTGGTDIEKYADGQYEIITGDCDTALAREMLYREHVHKPRLPLVSRDAKVSNHKISL